MAVEQAGQVVIQAQPLEFTLAIAALCDVPDGDKPSRIPSVGQRCEVEFAG